MAPHRALLQQPHRMICKILPEAVASTSSPNNPTLKLSPELVSAILSLGAKMPADTLLVYDSEHGLGWNDPEWLGSIFWGRRPGYGNEISCISSTGGPLTK